MAKCTALEPAPTRFYAPSGLFSPEDLRQLSAEYLGEVIVSPGGSFRYRVTSGPLCRLYWERGKPQPNVNESAYCRNANGKGWRRSHPNFLSYQIAEIALAQENPHTRLVFPTSIDPNRLSKQSRQ